MKPILQTNYVDKIEVVDVDTGEVKVVTPDLVQPVINIPYKTTLDGHSSGKGDSEVNNGEYLVDNTGYVDLETLYKRSLSQGVIPFKSFDSEISADAPLEDFEDEPLPETPNIEGNGSEGSLVELLDKTLPEGTSVEPVGETSTN